MAVPVLTYHSMRVEGRGYRTNDHIALAQDLRLLHRLGWKILSLQELVRLRLLGCVDSLIRTAAITFNDGPNLDWYDIDTGRDGRQRGRRFGVS